jgi:tRNA (adenine57-N1/adenine58-N1)-methyltransferase
MKYGELVLLHSKDSSYITEVSKGKLHTKDGVIDLQTLRKKRFGSVVKTHLNKKFVIIKPNILDVLEKRMKRLPQIIMPKDMGLIVAYTGVSSGDLVVDAGTGSGFLAIMLANYVRPGKVVTYENEKRFFKVAGWNIKQSGLDRYIKLKKRDVVKGIEEKNVDLITLDMRNPERVIKHAYAALKPGGRLVVYSPYIEQTTAVMKEMKKKNFCNIKTVENIVREWQFEKYTRPKTLGLMHTGFLTFARKLV